MCMCVLWPLVRGKALGTCVLCEYLPMRWGAWRQVCGGLDAFAVSRGPLPEEHLCMHSIKHLMGLRPHCLRFLTLGQENVQKGSPPSPTHLTC